MKAITATLSDSAHALVKKASKQYEKPLYECIEVFLVMGAKMSLDLEKKNQKKPKEGEKHATAKDIE